MYCTNCGNQIPDGSAFCPQCGARVTTTPVPSASTLPTAAESVVSKKRGFPLVPVMAALVAVAAIVALVVLVLPNLMGGANRPTGMSAGGDHTVALRSDGTVVAAGANDDGQCDVSGWSDVVAVSAGDFHTVGLRSDGTVVAAGYNDYGQCGVSGWTGVVAISAGDYHTVGLRSDGTVVAAGDNDAGQCDVSGWDLS